MQVPAQMKLQFAFENCGDAPVYLNVEPTPDRYLLQPGEELQYFAVPTPDDHPPKIVVLNEEITIWPESRGDDLTLIDGANAELRSWSD